MQQQTRTCDRCGRHDGTQVAISRGKGTSTKEWWVGDLDADCEDSVRKAVLRAVAPTTDVAKAMLAKRQAEQRKSKEASNVGTQPAT